MPLDRVKTVMPLTIALQKPTIPIVKSSLKAFNPNILTLNGVK